MSQERTLILQMLQQGRLTVEEAERLLAAVHEAPIDAESGEPGEGDPLAGSDAARPADDLIEALEAVCAPAQPGDVQAAFETTVPLPAGGRIRLKDAHGGAVVTGADVGQVQIRVLKRVRARDGGIARRLLQQFEIRVGEENGELVVRSSRPHVDRGTYNPVQGMWAFYHIVVPRGAGVTVEFQHGRVRVSHLEGSVDLTGAHGDWESRDLGGAVRLRHEHGGVRLINLGGGLEAHKAHGPLEIDGLRGALKLKAGHSPVRLSRLEGSAEMSGGHGDWEGVDLAGPVQLRHEHGSVRLERIGGTLDARKSHGSLEVTGVGGDLRLHSEHGSRVIREIVGSAEIRHSHGPVEIHDLHGGLQASVHHGRLEVDLARPLAGEITLRLEHSHSSLHLPSGSSASVELSAHHGHIEAPGFATVERGRHSERVRGVLGSGEHAVRVECHHSGIKLLAEDPLEAGVLA